MEPASGLATTRRAPRLWLAFVLSCEPSPPVVAPVVPAPLASSTELAPPSELVALTDEQCVASGGRVWTEKDAARLDKRLRQGGEPLQPFRVCRYPAPENGRSCTDSDACGAGRCRCTDGLAGPNPHADPRLAPLDQTSGAGVCSDEPLPTGDWYCLVEGGLIQLRGLILD